MVEYVQVLFIFGGDVKLIMFVLQMRHQYDVKLKEIGSTILSFLIFDAMWIHHLVSSIVFKRIHEFKCFCPLQFYE